MWKRQFVLFSFNRNTVALSPRIDYMNKLWHRIKQQRAMLDVANSDTRFLEIWANANVRRMACLEFDFTLEAMNILWNNFKGASRESKVSFVREFKGKIMMEAGVAVNADVMDILQDHCAIDALQPVLV
jgi:hypothetical protein